MNECPMIIESIVDSEIDDMILDLVYEIHSSLKGCSQEQIQINKTISIDKQTCACPNCGQTNLIATRFAYHLAKCLGAGRQSSRQAQRRIIDQIMIITDSDENQFETNSISEDGSSCTDSTSSSLTLINSNKNHFQQSNDEEDDWKPKKRKRKTIKKTNKKKHKDLLLLVSPTHSPLHLPNCLLPLNQIHPVTKHVVIPIAPLPVGPSNGEQIFFKNHHQLSSIQNETSNYLVHSPLNLVDEDQSSIIIFKEDIQN